MPVVKPVSELQRNFAAVADVCHETNEPVYLTKNGSASLVLIDSDVYDSQMRLASEVREREECVSRAIARGYDDILNGRTRSWEQARADASRIREARHGA